jgi:ribosomal protein L4
MVPHGLDIRPAKLVSRLSEFQASEFQTKDQMLQWLEEVLEGERALKAERARKPKPAKTAGERRRRGEGNSPAWRGGGSIGG